MTRFRTTLLLTAAGLALFAGSAQADDAIDATIATAEESDTALAIGGETEQVALAYPERYAVQQDRKIGCSGEYAASLRKGYLYRYYGIDIADGRPTSQAEATVSCGMFTVNVGSSVLLGDRGEHVPAGIQSASAKDSDRLANESWVSVSLHPTVNTPVGRFEFTLGTVYRFLDHRDGAVISDDYSEVVIGVRYPITIGDVTARFGIESVKINPINDNNSLYAVSERLELEWRRADDFSLNFDIAYSHNVNSVTAVIHRNVWYGSLNGEKYFPEHNLAIRAGVQFSQYAGYDRRFDFVVERDGRLLKAQKHQGPQKAGFTYFPFVSIVKYWR